LVSNWFLVGNSVNYIRKDQSSMNQKLKQAGLFAILAVFTLSMTTSLVADAEASPQSRGELEFVTPELSVKAVQRAEATPEVEAESPRSSSNANLPAGGPVELSVKAQHKAQLLAELNVEASPSLQQITVQDSATKAGKDFVVTGDVTTFTVAYAVVNPANIDLRNVEILVTSDTESVKGELIGKYDKIRSIISVEIDAVDPASVNAKIIA